MTTTDKAMTLAQVRDSLLSVYGRDRNGTSGDQYRSAWAKQLADAIDAHLSAQAKVPAGLGCASMVSENALYIKWSDAPDWANWFAADFFTQCWWYENRPVAGGNQWIPDGGKTMRAFSRTDWKETLQTRPALITAAPESKELW